MDLDEVVALSVKHNAADLHLCSGHLPHWQRQGVLEPIPQQAMLADEWLTAMQQAELEPSGARRFCDYTQERHAAARESVYAASWAFARPAADCRPGAGYRQPAGAGGSERSVTQLEEGLILITGATGKSTTLEDPIEFVHAS